MESREHMWEQVKQAIVESVREVCGSVRVGGGNPKSLWLNEQLLLEERRMLGRRCWEIDMKMQKKSV